MASQIVSDPGSDLHRASAACLAIPPRTLPPRISHLSRSHGFKLTHYLLLRGVVTGQRAQRWQHRGVARSKSVRHKVPAVPTRRRARSRPTGAVRDGSVAAPGPIGPECRAAILGGLRLGRLQQFLRPLYGAPCLPCRGIQRPARQASRCADSSISNATPRARIGPRPARVHWRRVNCAPMLRALKQLAQWLGVVVIVFVVDDCGCAVLTAHLTRVIKRRVTRSSRAARKRWIPERSPAR